MSWPAAFLGSHRRMTAFFVMAELVLCLAIPFLAIAGYHTLLDSQAGRFVEDPTERQPGWRALVDPTPLVAVVEMAEDRVTGVALLASHSRSDVDEAAALSGAGTVILVPGTLVVDGRPLDQRTPEEAVAALAAVLRLRMSAVELVDGDRWASVLGGSTFLVSNPDPVVDDTGEPLLDVGPTEVGATNAEAFLGRPASGADPLTLLFRRELFWGALLADPPTGDDALHAWLASAAGPGAQVVELPWFDHGGGPTPDLVLSENLIREVVPVPAGSSPGDRIQVRVIDRTGTADLVRIAADVASTGLEVVEIGNAAEFDGGLTHLVVPAGLRDQGLNELAALTGAATVDDAESESHTVVTLLVGSDYAIRNDSGALN